MASRSESNSMSKRTKRQKVTPRRLLEESSSNDETPIAPSAPKTKTAAKKQRQKSKRSTKTALQTTTEMENDRRRIILEKIEKLDAQVVKDLLVDACINNEAMKAKVMNAAAAVGEEGAGGDSQPDPPPPAPPTAPKWCMCGRCTEMPVVRHNVCCMTVPCRAHTEDFDAVALTPVVLHVQGIFRRELYGMRNAPPEHADENKRHRFASYTNFIMWVYGKLGRGEREMIPSCCINRIHDRWPDPNGHYTWFKDAHVD